MKDLVKEVPNEGLESLIGQRVTLFCGVYIYTGMLVGVNDTCVKLEDAGIVYETGSFSDKKWKDMQSLPSAAYVRTQAIEMFTTLK